jgi:hypothetical protein
MELSTFLKWVVKPSLFISYAFMTLLVILFYSSKIISQVGPGSIAVNNPTGGFHIEGNLQANTPTIGIGDWVPGPAGAGGNVLSAAGVPVNALTTFHLTDPYNTAENNFAGGKKFNDNPNSWTWVTNNAGAKCDINNALFHFTTTGSGTSTHTWLIVAADRRSNSGNAYIDFEFFQNTMTDNADGSFSSAGPNGGRTINDLLLTLALTNGGGTAEFFVNRWETIPGGYDYIDKTSVVPAGSVYASTNAATVPVSFGAFGTNQYSANLFVEAAIDLTALLGAIDPCLSLGVKTLFIKTKTSQSPTATLVDFISAKQVQLTFGGASAGSDQSVCSNSFTVSGNATPSPGDLILSKSWSVVPGSGTATISTPNDFTSSVTVTSSSVKLALSVTTNRGCVLKDTVQLTVLSTPAPSVTVVNNCASSTLTASNYTGTLLWSTGETTPSITVNSAGTYTVTQTVNSCTSSNGSGVAAPKTIPGAPTVGVVNNCNGTATLTASNYTGSLLWSTGETTPSITVNIAGTYTVTQTVNGCPSGNGSGVAAPKTNPGAPTVGVVNNCNGTSTLTASNYTGSLMWSTGETTASIIVNSAGTYTVTQTVNGCTGGNGSGVATPKTNPGAPTVGVVNNCNGTSTLTASNYTGSLMWSTGETTASIIVNSAGTYTVTQTVNGCTSANGSGVAAPKSLPGAPLVTYNPPACNENTFSVTVSNVSSGAIYSILDKNGNTIAGVSPGNSYQAPNGNNFSFSNIPAGSGYQVSVSINGCSGPANSCGVNNLNLISSTTLKAAVQPETKVLAYPNPFTDKVRFRLESSTGGHASLDIYNVLGQKVKTPFQGNMQKGEVRTIDVYLPNAAQSNLMYIFRIGNDKVSGKLLKL